MHLYSPTYGLIAIRYITLTIHAAIIKFQLLRCQYIDHTHTRIPSMVNSASFWERRGIAGRVEWSVRASDCPPLLGEAGQGAWVPFPRPHRRVRPRGVSPASRPGARAKSPPDVRRWCFVISNRVSLFPLILRPARGTALAAPRLRPRLPVPSPPPSPAAPRPHRSRLAPAAAKPVPAERLAELMRCILHWYVFLGPP